MKRAARELVERVQGEALARASACVLVYNRAMGTELGDAHCPLDMAAWVDTFEGCAWTDWRVALGADQAVVGFFVACGYEDGPSVLQMLAVDPEHQKRGWGAALLASALDGFKERGNKIAVAFVRAESERSQAFYVKSRGRVIEEIEEVDYYGKAVYPVLFDVSEATGVEPEVA